jgi:CheY-like chemotaxis protein/anti-sigma regulatory factor (Ser/Thr protein kinase)
MVVQETLALIRPAAAERGIRLETAGSTGATASYVHADRQRLAQVLLNLLSNAVKYSGIGGMVRVECDYAPGSSDRIRIAVRDEGPGIPADKHERLFTPFERLGAEQSGVEGTGLGLALSQRLVEGMGGTLDFETTVGVGSTFWAEFPRADDPVERLRQERPAAGLPQSDQASGTVLYVEDNLANLSLIESVMHSRPRIELIPALQGRIGLDLARRHAPDLVLLDLHLPDLSGEEVLRHLKAEPATRHIPVVFITADAMPGTAERLLAAGAAACLAKPLDIDEFLGTLDRLLGRRVSA